MRFPDEAGLVPPERRSFTQFSISDFLKRHTVPILPEGISPFCAQSYTVRSETLKYFATSSIVRISSFTANSSCTRILLYYFALFAFLCQPLPISVNLMPTVRYGGKPSKKVLSF